MANYEIIETKAVPHSEVLDIVKKKSKDRELTYREEKTLEYLKKVSHTNKKDSETMIKELTALEIPRLEVEHIIKIVDIMPKDGTELRAIVSHSGTVLVDESVTQILDVIKKFRK